MSVVFKGVTFAYPKRSPALRSIDLSLDPGDFTVLMGESGSGKSTMLRAVNGLVPHASGGEWQGDVLTAGRSVRDHRPHDFAETVGFVHQDPESHFVVDQVEHDIAYVLENLGLDQTTMRRRVEEALDALAIAHLRDRAPHELSGGESQRAAIAAALVAAPDVLLLDEPTSQLDPQAADDVLAALARLNADLGTTVIVAEHRLERALPLAQRAVLLQRGEVVADGDPRDVIVDYSGKPTVVALSETVGWSPVALTVREARAAAASAPMLETPPDEAAPPGESVARCLEITVSLAQRRVLHGVTVELHEGETVALLGRNGAGKTTLLRAVAGLVPVERGERVVSRDVAYLPQDPNALLSATTVRAELAQTLRLLGMKDEGQVDAWLDQLGLRELADAYPRSLSAGERQRVALGAVAVGGAPILLLDEPTRGMDAAAKQSLRRVAEEHAAAGGTVVIATHDIELAAQVASRVVVMADGEVVADGSARQVLTSSLFPPHVSRVFPGFLTVEEVAQALEGRR